MAIKRNFLSTNNTTNVLLFTVGGALFLLGGSALSLPGLIAIFLGVIGFIKYRKVNLPDKKLPWGIIMVAFFVVLGLLSLLILVGVNPYEQVERTKGM